MDMQHFGNLKKKAKIDFFAPIVDIDPVLSINGTPFGTLGNFSVITGRAKARKTFATTLITACAVLGKSEGAIKANFPKEKKKILYFDTEQSTMHVQLVASRIRKMVGDENVDCIEMYQMREFDSRTNREFIMGVIDSSSEKVGLVIIDGIRDLMVDFNNVTETALVMDFLKMLTKKYHIHVVTVIHQNKGSDLIRGHLGTELVNKAETVAEVKLQGHDKSRSVFQPMHTKNSEFQGFLFYVNEDGIPIIDNQAMPTVEQKSSIKQAPGDYSTSIHYRILDKLDDETAYDRKTITNKLKEAIKDVTGTDYGQTKRAEFLTYYVEEGYLNTSGTPGSKTVRYHVNTNPVDTEAMELTDESDALEVEPEEKEEYAKYGF
jgi:hypothetical protein